MDQWDNAIVKTSRHFLSNLSQILFDKNVISGQTLFHGDYHKILYSIWNTIQDLDVVYIDENFKFMKTILPVQGVEAVKTMDLFIKQGFLYFYLDFYKSWKVKRKWIGGLLKINRIDPSLTTYEKYILENLGKLSKLAHRFLNQQMSDENIKLTNPLFHGGKLYYDLIVRGGAVKIDDKLNEHIRAVLTEGEYQTLVDILSNDNLLNLVRIGKLKLVPDFKSRVLGIINNDIPSSNELKAKIADLFQEATPAQLADVESVVDIVGSDKIDPKLFLGKMVESLHQAQWSKEIFSEILGTDFGDSFGMSSRELQAALIFELLKEKNVTPPTINIIVDGKKQLHYNT